MTPEEAKALEPGTTPGPWTMHRYVPEDFIRVTGEDLTDIADNGIVKDADAYLIAAAPEMRATIAAQTWEYGVEWDSPHSPGVRLIEWPWRRAEDDAREFMTSSPALQNPRLVRRLVGPVETVDPTEETE